LLDQHLLILARNQQLANSRLNSDESQDNNSSIIQNPDQINGSQKLKLETPDINNMNERESALNNITNNQKEIVPNKKANSDQEVVNSNINKGSMEKQKINKRKSTEDQLNADNEGINSIGKLRKKLKKTVSQQLK
jgi:hypothetical protein